MMRVGRWCVCSEMILERLVDLSCVKPLKYAIAVNDLGTEYVHRYVGKEPSGLRFNKLFLNEDGKNYIKVNWKKKYLNFLCKSK